LHLVGILFPHINNDAWSKSHQIRIMILITLGLKEMCVWFFLIECQVRNLISYLFSDI